MIRLTTPTHTFLFDSDPTEYAKILVTYAQGNRIVMEKEKGLQPLLFRSRLFGLCPHRHLRG